MSIVVKNISKNYGNQKALDKVNLSINKSEIVGFLGPNGAGKSTLMKIITGYITPCEGTVLVDDFDIVSQKKEAQKKIGYLSEHNPLYVDMYVKEYLIFCASVYGISKTKVDSIVDSVGLSVESHKKISALSKGYRQRVGLAAALLHNPDILILDEPTTGLDPNQLVEIRNLIQQEGKEKIILFSTHILQEVEMICDRVILINKGKIIEDKALPEFIESMSPYLEVRFDKNIAFEKIGVLQGVLNSEQVNDTTWRLDYTTASEENLRVALFDLAQENQVKILELASQKPSLEELFRKLTS